MNQGLFKLVYSKVLHMYVPASEAVRSRSGKGGARVRKQAKHLFEYALVLVLFQSSGAWADVPTAISLRSAVNAVVSSGINSTVINQNAPKAILNWDKLNTGKGYLLKFNQQGHRDWSALNRIHDVDPSVLNGIVQADGNVYFINANGIVIGKDAQFNVGSLYAGTLDIKDDLFNSGFINSDGVSYSKVFNLVGSLDVDEQTRHENAKVLVESGAKINTATNGKVLLFAPDVENNGLITTPDGQTILAAGKTIYLASSKDPAGFLVEVGGGGKATNLGQIVANRGNITMIGLAVRQAGTLSASTSVRANGSIHLLAQDSATVTGSSDTALGVTGVRNGLVTIEKGSVTEANPDVNDKETTNTSQSVAASKIKIEASLINIDGKISAKGGSVTATTTATNNLGTDAAASLGSVNKQRIYLGDNAEIDVSGVDAVAPMSRNQLEIQLFSDQLKDAPILRDGGLFKQTVYVDARKGTSLFDIQPFLDLVPQTIAEKMTKAGTITLSTPQDLIVSKGAKLDVSGGSITYEPGRIKETNLFYKGKLVPISEAKPGVPYDTIADVKMKDNKWGVTRGWDIYNGGTKGWGRFVDDSKNNDLRTVVKGAYVASYFNGSDAGTLDLTVSGTGTPIYTKSLVLAGSVLANTKVSAQQMMSQELPLSGQLIASANQLTIADVAKDFAADFTAVLPDSEQYESVLSTDFLASGFNRINFAKVKTFVVNDTMNLGANGELVAGSGKQDSAQINANIIAPGSNIQLNALNTKIADGVTISTAGRFTNDKAGVKGAFQQAAVVNGGNITVGYADLGKNVTLDASAGAWVNNKGVLSKGSAGNIDIGVASKIDDSVTLQSYGFAQGGTLTVDYHKFNDKQSVNVLGNPNASSTDIDIDKRFFSQGGFSKYAIKGFNVNIGDNTASPQEIYTQQQNLVMNAGFAKREGGQAITAVTSKEVLPDANRKAVSLSFTADKLGGVLSLAENTTLRTDRGGSVSLAGGKQVNVLGDITTPSGTIDIKINDLDGTLPYDASQAVFVGSKATLSAAGSSVILPDSKPDQRKTQVFNAGTINMDAPKGALVVKDGAVLDVSGASVINDTKTVAGFKRETLYGDAGTIKLSASDALLLDGEFKGAATGTGRSGTLDLSFNSTTLEGGSPALTGKHAFAISQNKQLAAGNFVLGDTLKTDAGDVYTQSSTDALNGRISAEQINEGGFANLNVKSYGVVSSGLDNSVQLKDGLDLKIAGNLKLESSLIQVQDNGVAKVSAGHIALISRNANLDTNTIETGNGVLTTESKQLYLSGQVAVAGTKQNNINTSQDITGVLGGLYANGDINLTARQIYPVTRTTLSFEALGDGSNISVNSSGAAAQPILSAAGTLNLKADNIVQNGVLTAPLGSININAKNSATFSAASVTSISAQNQIIPLDATSLAGSKLSLPPSKGINISGASVDVKSGAKLDLSGGGDTLAVEFVPGIGGSKDIRFQANTYAVIPSLGLDYSPQGLDASTGTGVGQSVYLTGVPGLPSGTYTLLPASYALVPGAYLVQAGVSSTLLPKQTAKQLDGSTYTTGYLADAATGAHDAVWSTFKVIDGAVLRTNKSPSQYVVTSANTFFSDSSKLTGLTGSLPKDAGKLTLAANKLVLDGTVQADKGAGGKGLTVDINSENIRVVSSLGADDGSLQLTANSLNALKAESLLLGGSRTLDKGVEKITTGAKTVSIENDSAHAVNTAELIASGTESVTVRAGAVINTGAGATEVKNKTIEASGDGALLALSSNSNISYSRTGSSAAATQGDLILESGSTLSAAKSLVLDATNNSSNAASLSLQDGGSATFGAKRILLGSPAASELGLNVNATTLAGLGQLSALTLNSYTNIDTFGQVDIGNKALDLTINAGGIAGHLADGEVSGNVPADAVSSVITARTFTLKNTQSANFVSPSDPSERGLQINANMVRLEGADAASTTTVAGYSKLNINADEVRVAKVGETDFNVAQTTITTGRITADTAANFKVKSSDTLAIAQLANAKTTAQTGIGATLKIEATDLTVGSKIDVQSGALALSATHDLNLVSGANVSSKSTSIRYDNQVQDVGAGIVTLSSTTGNVNVDAGAVVDVTSQGAANAGLVQVIATAGTANIAGDIKGEAGGTGKGGKLEMDVGSLAHLSNTNHQASGFSEKRQYRVRTGDVAIDGTGANGLTAREAIVSADAGQITVSGDIVATANKNSRIGLYANSGVTLESTANLKANSTQAGEEGGKVEIFTKTGSLNLAAGSRIDVSGGAGAAGGDVHLRAPRTGGGSGNGVAVTQLGTDITGAKSTVLEAFRTFTATTITTGSGTGATLGFTTLANDVNNFMANKTSILSALGMADDDTFHLRAGVDVQSTGNLTIAADWNLYSATRAGGEPGVLTLRAKDNIVFNGSLSDGFTTAATTADLGEGNSWSYRIVAGADTAAANLLETKTPVSSSLGNISLANNKLIRTGTGDIDIAAGGDLKMLGANAAIYTVGRSADVLDGFDAPQNSLKPLYLTDGGDISITTKGNIVGAEPASGRQLINQWLFRQGGGTLDLDTSWWVRPDLFKQSLATMGGGDVNIKAGGNISNFSASAATTARFDTNGTTGKQVVNGGGDVKVAAAGDIINGVYFVAKGDGELAAGGAIKKVGDTFGTTLALQDGSFKVSAGKDVYIETTINPTLISQSVTNATLGNLTGNNAYFNTYSENAKVSVASLTGDLTYGAGNAFVNKTTGLDTNANVAVNYNPANLELVSHHGDVNLGSEQKILTLMPSATGHLKLLADQDVNVANITMSDAAPSSIPSIESPLSVFAAFKNTTEKAIQSHGLSLLHANDNEPALIVAQEGDINPIGISTINLAKNARFVAGNDINNLNITTQNNRASDITLIKAGQDVKVGNVEVSGPGELLVQAGRNVDLSSDDAIKKIKTTGGVNNPALPSDGASITLQAGLGKGANVQGYIEQYILPSGQGPAVLKGNASKLADYRAATITALTDYMRKLSGNSGLSSDDALAQFNGLSLEAKTIFVNRHLTTELVASAKDFAKAGSHERAYNALASLFPNASAGDINLYKSKITTNSGGSVDLLAPGGVVNIGVAGLGGDIGVITEKGGEIRGIANSGFNVNQSKVITQFGSDITVWSTTGTIDAGRGSKTATSVPERIVQTDADGNTTIEVRGIAAGSGIRAQSYDPDGPNGPKEEPKKGKVTLIAPTVDAGEAGIEAGDLLLVATTVLNANNITVQGSSAGVPAATSTATVSAGAGVSPNAMNEATAAVAQSVAQSANNTFAKPSLPSVISVDVISIGK